MTKEIRAMKMVKAWKPLILPFSLLVLSFPALSEPAEPCAHDEAAVSSVETNVAVNAVAKSRPRYTSVGIDEAALNDQGAPIIGDVDFGGVDGTTVRLWPLNVKPNLWYGLGRSETPMGPFIVEDGAWVRADADGVLHEALTAPKIGPQGFYRVLVR